MKDAVFKRVIRKLGKLFRKKKIPVINLIEQAGGVVHEIGLLPDNVGFATASFPLPKDHWIYGNPEYPDFEPPPMPMKMGIDDPRRKEFSEALRQAGEYALRASTLKGKSPDFDPDAVIQNLVVGVLGYHTCDGLSSDDWANPKKYRKD